MADIILHSGLTLLEAHQVAQTAGSGPKPRQRRIGFLNRYSLHRGRRRCQDSVGANDETAGIRARVVRGADARRSRYHHR